MSRLHQLVLSLSITLTVIGGAAAQPPAAPLRLIVPLAAGGPSDQAARALAKALGPLLGQEVQVDNRAGANGALGAQALASAAPDGQTLLFAPAGLSGLPLLMKQPPMSSLADFSALAAVGGNQICLYIHPALPAQNLQEFIRHARSRAEPLNYGSSSFGEYLAAAQVIRAADLQLNRVPYRGSAQMMPDLLENRVQLSFMPPGSGQPQVQAGKLRVLGCNGTERLAALPQVPTLAEAGVATGSLPPWHFLLAPPRLPQAQASRLGSAILKAATDPAVRAEFERLYLSAGTLDAEQTLQAIRDHEQLWARFVREAGISPE